MRRHLLKRRGTLAPGITLRCGFTLVEILVVVAIVGVLAAIILPVFSGARERAHTATCASNLRQIGVALQLYATDHGNFLPTLGAGPNCSLWADKVYPYLKSTEVFQCPNYEYGDFEPGCGPPTSEGSDLLLHDGSYDLNYPFGRVECTIDPGGCNSSIPTKQVLHTVHYRNPSSTIMVLDGDGNFVNPGTQQPPFEGVDGLLRRGVNPRHNDGCNVGFADGHVKWLSLETLTDRNLWLLHKSR